MDNALEALGCGAVVAMAIAALTFVIYLIIELLDGVNQIRYVEHRLSDLQGSLERIEKKAAAAQKRRR